MKKKIVIGLAALGTAVALVPLFAAFEAHVINVTATIENALQVSANAIDFGTVFPQEHLDQPLTVELSGSFLTEDRVNDVAYFIRQKPKCGITSQNGTVLDHASTATGHLTVVDGKAVADCGPAPRTLVVDNDQTPVNEAETWGVLPSLCPYISKDGGDTDGLSQENDGTLSSFHQPWNVVNNAIVYTDVRGYLAKNIEDTVDNWTIDLAVPCFGGQCAQDWLSFVQGITGDEEMTLEEANAFTQPTDNEHKVFGCDLWVEVSDVSVTPPPPPLQ